MPKDRTHGWVLKLRNSDRVIETSDFWSGGLVPRIFRTKKSAEEYRLRHRTEDVVTVKMIFHSEAAEGEYRG